MLVPVVAMGLLQTAWGRCERRAELFWAAFGTASYQSFAVAAPRPLASFQQGDRTGSRQILLHLLYRPSLARYCDAAERNALARLQRGKNRLPRRASHGMNSQPRCAWFRIRRVKLSLTP